MTRIEDGFDFLGQNCGKCGGKLLIKPARDNIRAFLDNVRSQRIFRRRVLPGAARRQTFGGSPVTQTPDESDESGEGK